MMYEKEMNIAEKSIKKSCSFLLKEFKKKEFTTEAKGVKDIVTSADKGAEKIIVDTIKKDFPDHAILAEEGGSSGESNYKWIIDPLDGTHNFFFGIPYWGTMLALEHKGQIMLSVIGLPIFREICTAQKGKGSYVNGRRMHVSSRTDTFMVTFGGVYGYNDPVVGKSFEKVTNAFYHDMRMFGSIAVTGRFLADGRTDGVYGLKTTPWDMAPPSLLIEEAGGKVTDIKGRKCNHYAERFVASNGKIHRKMISVLK
ncbi:inositol monophosphatase [archaeon]|nr:inositol monophosphatase [archaeon]